MRCANCAPASSNSTDSIDRRSAARPARSTTPHSPDLTAGGVPEKLARRVARLALLEPALDIVALARGERDAGRRRGARLFRARRAAGPRLAAWRDRPARGRWLLAGHRAHRPARCSHARASRAHAAGAEHARREARRRARWRAGARSAPKRIASWKRTLTEMRAVGSTDFATLTVGVESVRSLSSELTGCASRW